MTVVCKVGGSLLSLPGVAQRLQMVLRRFEDRKCVLLVGGGASVDVVRDWSQIHGLDEEAAHSLAMASLDSCRKLMEKLSGWRSVSSRDAALQSWNLDPSPLLLDLDRFVRAEEAETGEALPHTWNVTSDSLAAWTAIQWPATELLLFKSIPTPHGIDAATSSEQGWVDRHFPLLAPGIPLIKWCNLRGSGDIDLWLQH